MKGLIVVACLAVAVSGYQPIFKNYHEEFGIPEASRIKRAEAARDFDNSRIAGGQVSALGQQPHFAGLLIDIAPGIQSMCGASLISYTRLLTAAHCWRLGDTNAIQLTAVLGSTNLFSGGVRRTTSDVEVHANYNPDNFNHDIAIVRIAHTPYTNTVLRILLPSENDDSVGAWATAVGFGRTGDTSANNQVQRHVQLQVISNEACRRVFGAGPVIASTLCTATTGGTSPCLGDTGGPLSVGSLPSHRLIGITTFLAAAGCTRGYPAGYTRVSSYNSWIRARL